MPKLSDLYDEKCYELAEYFIGNDHNGGGIPEEGMKSRQSLARAIQAAVEDWFSEHAKAKP